MTKGLVVIFEGIDGGGKSTLIDLVFNNLKKFGHDPNTYRAPGGTEYGENVRNAIFKSGIQPSNETILLAIMSSHAELTKSVLLSKTEGGLIVLLDRYMDSTYAYQGKSKADIDFIKTTQEYILGQNEFDKIRVFVGVDPSVAMDRLKNRTESNFFDEKPLSHFKELDSRYRQRYEYHQSNSNQYSHGVYWIDNNGSITESENKAVQIAKMIDQEYRTINLP